MLLCHRRQEERWQNYLSKGHCSHQTVLSRQIVLPIAHSTHLTSTKSTYQRSKHNHHRYVLESILDNLQTMQLSDNVIDCCSSSVTISKPIEGVFINYEGSPLPDRQRWICLSSSNVNGLCVSSYLVLHCEALSQNILMKVGRGSDYSHSVSWIHWAVQQLTS